MIISNGDYERDNDDGAVTFMQIHSNNCEDFISILLLLFDNNTDEHTDMKSYNFDDDDDDDDDKNVFDLKVGDVNSSTNVI